MCYGCNSLPGITRDELETLTRYVSEILDGKTLHELAKKEETTPEEIMEAVDKIKQFNPTAYEKVMERI